MKSVVAFLLKYPKSVTLLLVGLALVGFIVSRGLPVDVFPDIQAPRVVVQTEAGGLTAEEVESRITIPIESAMNGLPGVTTVRSSSGVGLSFVWVDFDWSTDLSKARFAVFERLAAIRESLPSGADPEIAPNVSVTGEIMLVALTSRTLSPLALRELGEFDLRTRLMGVSGIGEVVVIGGRLPECRVSVDPRELMGVGLTLGEVVEAVRDSRTLASAGYLPNAAFQEVPVRQMARADSVESLRRTAVRSERGVFRLGDVAEVTVAGAPRRGSASFGGEPAVVLSVQKVPGGNTPELTRALDAALDEFAALHAKDGVEVHRDAYRQADFIALSIAGGKKVVRDAVLVVILVLGLTVMKPRTVLVTLLTMPLSILFGMLVFPAFGLGVNVMTLGGLAVAAGDIVDGAIIFGEIIGRRLDENEARDAAERLPLVSVIGASVVEVLPSVAFSTLIIVFVFLPLLMLSGIESSFFRPLALSYLSIFVSSFVVSMLAVPVLSLLLWRPSRRGAAKKEAVTIRVLKATYAPFLTFVMRFPGVVVVLSAAALGVAVYLAASFGGSFLPAFREDAYNVFVSTPPGTSLEETERVTEASVSSVASIGGVLSVCRRTGRAERDQHAEPVSTSELVVRVDPKADADRVAAEIRERLGSVPGLSVTIGYPIAHRISAVLSGVESELAINIFGERLEVLRDAAKRTKAVLDALPQVVDARANREIMTESLRVDYDLDALAEAGLTLREAGEQVAAGFSGVSVGTIHSGLRRREVVVRANSSVESPTAADLRGFVLSSKGGRCVRLDEVASVVPEEVSNLIVREGLRRKALVSCNVRPGSNVGELVATLRERLDPMIREMGCSVSYGGSYSARESAARRLGVLGVALVAVIFGVLVLALGSPGGALLALVNVPLSVVGGIVAVKLTDPVLSVSSLVGFVTVIGFTLRNGILLVNRFDELGKAGLDRQACVRQGSLERMVPVLMTSLTTVVGLVPIVRGADIPGGELLAPLAVVQLGGLIGATLLTLLVLPAAAVLFAGPKPKGVVAALLAVSVLAGCKSYAPRQIDWTAEAAAFGNATKVTVRSVDDLERLALVGNPEINRLRLKLAKSEAVAKETGWWEDPELDFDLNRIVNPSENPWLGGVSVAFTVPLSGAPRLEAEAARHYCAADAWAIRAAELALKSDLRKALVRYGAATRRQNALGAYLHDVSLTNALARFDRLSADGEFARADFVTARREHHAREHAYVAAGAERETALVAVRRLLGLSPEVAIDGLDALDALTTDGPLALSPTDLVRHPLVQERLSRLDGSERALEAQIRRQYPDLKLGPAYSREDGEDRFGVVAGLTLPLWNRNRKAIAEAEGERELDRFEAVDVWRTVVTDYVAARGRYERSRLRLADCSHAGHEGDVAAMERLAALGEIDDREYVSRRGERLDAELLEQEQLADCAEAAAELRGFKMEMTK